MEPLVGLATGVAQSMFNAGFSELAARKQHERQLQFWNMQNKYNSPSSQRGRLRSAGFNPSMALGEVASSQAAGELSSVPGNEVMLNGVLDPTAVKEWLLAFADLENTVAGTNHLTAQIGTELTKQLINTLQAAGIKIDNETKKVLYKYADEHQRAQLDKLAAETKAAEASAGLATEQATTESETRELKKDNITADTDVKKSQAANLDKSTELLQKQINWYDTNQAAALELVRAQVATLSAETRHQIIKTGIDAILFQREDFVKAASAVYGFDISNLPPATKTTALSIFKSVLKGDWSLEKAMQSMYRIMNAARVHETSVLESWGVGYNFMGVGYSESATQNTNK